MKVKRGKHSTSYPGPRSREKPSWHEGEGEGVKVGGREKSGDSVGGQKYVKRGGCLLI